MNTSLARASPANRHPEKALPADRCLTSKPWISLRTLDSRAALWFEELKADVARASSTSGRPSKLSSHSPEARQHQLCSQPDCTRPSGCKPLSVFFSLFLHVLSSLCPSSTPRCIVDFAQRQRTTAAFGRWDTRRSTAVLQITSQPLRRVPSNRRIVITQNISTSPWTLDSAVALGLCVALRWCWLSSSQLYTVRPCRLTAVEALRWHQSASYGQVDHTRQSYVSPHVSPFLSHFWINHLDDLFYYLLCSRHLSCRFDVGSSPATDGFAFRCFPLAFETLEWEY